jgi:hypothetical protein
LKIIFAKNQVEHNLADGFLCHAVSVRRKFVSVNLRSSLAGRRAIFCTLPALDFF